ncbi:hypothetical protein Hanom_Chr06g00516661 [Helianthus anomalus]
MSISTVHVLNADLCYFWIKLIKFYFHICAKCFRLVQNMDLKFISTHNQAGYLAAPPAKHKELYTPLIKGLNSCRLTARFDALEAEGKGALIAEIEKKSIVVTEQMIREVLQFNDQETDPIELPAGTVEAIFPRLSYEGKFPPLVKKFVHPYWRLLIHMFILCMTENRGGTDQLNITQSAAFTCLITNAPFNYSKYIFEGMKRNVTGVRKDKFLMYPRFLQMIFNARYPDLVRSGDTFVTPRVSKSKSIKVNVLTL